MASLSSGEVARQTVDDLLSDARAQIARVDPRQASDAIGDGALLIDIRSESQRERDGVVPDAVFIPRNVLEWRCDPASRWRDPGIGGHDRELIVMCDEGYASSLAAATLKQLGFERAADLTGGFQAWRAAGLPVAPA